MTTITFAQRPALSSPADTLAGVLRPGSRPVKPTPGEWLPVSQPINGGNL